MTTTLPDQSKSIYRAFCEGAQDVPIFLQPWWLDADAGPDRWDVVVLLDNGRPIAALPYCRTRLRWFRGIGMPPVAPYMGCHIRFPEAGQKRASRIAWEQQALRALFEGLPARSFFFQHFFPDHTNWTALYWMGYRQTTRYSYVIDDLSNLEAVFAGFENRARTAIRKAERDLTVSAVQHSGVLYELLDQTFGKQSLPNPYPADRLAAVTGRCLERDVGRLYVVRDEAGRAHAAAFVVWDRGKAYWTVQAADPGRLSAGGPALMVWHAIREAAAAGIGSFDFTGSVMPNVERFLRQFGGRPVPRHYIAREEHPLLHWLMRWKEARESRRTGR
ncbi:MAG: hypothetical protein RLY31_1576 [Bacteroidota bacterium]|jgi:hypothetical protein